jgi:hypothetical protein
MIRTQVCYTSLPKYKDDEKHNDTDHPRKNKGFAFIEYSKVKEARAAVKGADSGQIKLHGVALSAMEKLVWLDQKKSFRWSMQFYTCVCVYMCMCLDVSVHACVHVCVRVHIAIWY